MDTLKWKCFSLEDCPDCGDHLLILSEHPASTDTDDQVACSDGDKISCQNCDYESFLSVDEDGYILQD